MKYLEAKILAARAKAASRPESPPIEHKMQPGIRNDQQPEKLTRTYRKDVVAFAAQCGVNLDEVEGTGADGAVLLRDVRRHKEREDGTEQG